MPNTQPSMPLPPAPGGFPAPGGANQNPSGSSFSYGASAAAAPISTPIPLPTPTPSISTFSQPSSTQPTQNFSTQSLTADSEVHTMPEKFLPEVHTKKRMGSVQKFLFIGGTIVLIMAIVTTAVVIIFSRKQAATNENAVIVNTAVVNRTNLNTNVNANTNVAVNTNTPVNAVLNTNTIINTNTPVNTNVSTNFNQNTPPNTSGQIVSSRDTDKDGLTDNEEIIWASSVTKPDTDGDGFLDGEEILHGFSPVGPGNLSQDPNAVTYLNPTYSYSIVYPSRWVQGQLDNSDVDVLFTAETGEFVEVTVASNPKQETAKQWYLDQFPELKGKDLQTFAAESLTGVKSLDGLTGYVAAGNAIYIITYNIGTRQAANFISTFDMMLNTFSISANGQITNSNSVNNTNVTQ